MDDKEPQLEIIERDHWPRHAHFKHYSTLGKCVFNVTATIDVTRFILRCKSEQVKFYPMLVAIVAKIVNSIPEFRMGIDEHGNPAIWNYVSPCYLVFHDDDKTFSCLFSEYSEDVNILYERIVENMDRFKDVKELFP